MKHHDYNAPLPAKTATPSATLRRRWLVTLAAMTLPLLLCFVYFVWLPGTAIGKAAYTGIKVWLLVWPILVGLILAPERDPKGNRYRWFQWIKLLPSDVSGAQRRSSKHGPRQARWRSILIGSGFGLAVAAFAWLLLSTPSVGAAINESGEQIRDQVTAFGVMKYYFAFGFFVAVIHSGLEEYYWRGFVFGNLRHLVPMWAAHLIAALAFMAHHVVVLHTFFPSPMAWLFSLGVALGGLIWSLLYQRHGTLLGAWVSHLIVDVVILVAGWQLIQG